MSCCGGGATSENACDLKKQCAFAKCESCPEVMVKCKRGGCNGRVHPLCWKKLLKAEFASQKTLQPDQPLCSHKCANEHAKMEGPR